METKEMNLWEKINEIQNGAMEVVKGGKNNFAKYNYKTFTNIKEAVMKKMHDLGVVFLPAPINALDMNLSIVKEGKATQVSYYQAYELINANKPDERQKFIFPMIGTNNDGADKANGSATTYGLKYLFNLWGLIPDESLDPDESVRDTAEVKKQQKQATLPNAKNFETVKKMLMEAQKGEPEAITVREMIKDKLGDKQFNPNNIAPLLNDDFMGEIMALYLNNSNKGENK